MNGERRCDGCANFAVVFGLGGSYTWCCRQPKKGEFMPPTGWTEHPAEASSCAGWESAAPPRDEPDEPKPSDLVVGESSCGVVAAALALRPTEPSGPPECATCKRLSAELESARREALLVEEAAQQLLKLAPWSPERRAAEVPAWKRAIEFGKRVAKSEADYSRRCWDQSKELEQLRLRAEGMKKRLTQLEQLVQSSTERAVELIGALPHEQARELRFALAELREGHEALDELGVEQGVLSARVRALASRAATTVVADVESIEATASIDMPVEVKP